MEEKDLNQKTAFVQSASGAITGTVHNGNCVFYNIPYGDRCDGQYRFSAPREVPNWQETLDCSRAIGVKACQSQKEIVNPTMKKGPLKEISSIFSGGQNLEHLQVENGENCLNLSIVTPNCDEKKRTVIVYIHGGGYNGGTSYVVHETCGRLCQEEDVVVVSVEHRLGAFGFLYLGCFDSKYETSGLNGLLDIILALKWIQKNIAVFGGDPEQVMLYGESGGAAKISHLLAMEEAKGLFKRAYLNSGACAAATVSKQEGEAETMQLLQLLNLNKDNYQKLFELPVDEIVAAQEKVKPLSSLLNWCPIADGKRLPYNAEQQYRTYPCSKDVELMLGNSEDEMMLLALKPFLSKRQLFKQLCSDRGSYLREDLSEQQIQQMIELFQNKDCQKRNCTHTYSFITSLFVFLGHGAYRLAQVWAQEQRKVYLYKVSYDTPLFGKKFKTSWHTVDLPLSFRAVYLKEHERISKDMAHFMCEFAKGRPVISGDLKWKPYDLQNRFTMVYDYNENHLVADPDKDIHAIYEEYRRSTN